MKKNPCSRKPLTEERLAEAMGLRHSAGFGDTVAKFTEATGIKKVVDTISQVTGCNCGCEERREKLNRMIPYRVHKN